MSLIMRGVSVVMRRGRQVILKTVPQASSCIFQRHMETAAKFRPEIERIEGVPVIDISSLVGNASEEDKYDTSLEIGKALRDLGFLYVINHGVEQSLRDKMMDWCVKFFDMPLEKKMEVVQAKDSVRGYVNFGTERTYSRADWKEAMYHMTETEIAPAEGAVNLLRGKNPWPDPEFLPGFKEDNTLYVQKMNALGHIMMSAIAVSLGLDKDFFKREYITNPFTEFGIFHYPKYESSRNIGEDSEWGIGPHTDYGCLTLLSQCQVGGLQVQTTDGRWVDAPPRPDAFVVNACDMLEAWTNGACRSSPHRVKLPTANRYSVVAFFGPDVDSLISPLPLKHVGNAKFTHNFNFPVHYGEYVAKKYLASYSNKTYK